MEGLLLLLPGDLPASLQDVLVILDDLEPRDFPEDTRIVFLIPRHDVVTLKGATRHPSLPHQGDQPLDNITAVHDATNNGMTMLKDVFALDFVFDAVSDNVILHNDGRGISVWNLLVPGKEVGVCLQQLHYALEDGLWAIQDQHDPNKWVAFKTFPRSFELVIRTRMAPWDATAELTELRGEDVKFPSSWFWGPCPGEVLAIVKRQGRNTEYQLENMEMQRDDNTGIDTITIASKHTGTGNNVEAVTRLFIPCPYEDGREEGLHICAKRHAAEVRNNQLIQDMLSSCPCPNIASFLGADSRLLTVTMGHSPQARDLVTLRDEAAPFNVPLQEQLQITHDALAGLHWLHTHAGLLHLDIRPQNVLVGPGGAVFLTGFAYSTELAPRNDSDHQEDQSTYTMPAYLPPEVLKGRRQGCPGDIWSLGVTMLGLSGQHDRHARLAWLGDGPSIVRMSCREDEEEVALWRFEAEKCSSHTISMGRWANTESLSRRERGPGPNETTAGNEAAAALYYVLSRMVEQDEGERISARDAIEILMPYVKKGEGDADVGFLSDDLRQRLVLV